MELNKEELLKEYFKIHGVGAPIAKKENESNPAVFEWIWNKINDAQTNEALCREEVKVLMRQVLENDSKISHLEALLLVADEVIGLGYSPESTDHSEMGENDKYYEALEKYNQLKTKQ